MYKAHVGVVPNDTVWVFTACSKTTNLLCFPKISTYFPYQPLNAPLALSEPSKTSNGFNNKIWCMDELLKLLNRKTKIKVSFHPLHEFSLFLANQKCINSHKKFRCKFNIVYKAPPRCFLELPSSHHLPQSRNIIPPSGLCISV